MPLPGPQDYGDVEPTPRSQAWSAQPESVTDPFVRPGAPAPGVFVPPPPAHPGQTRAIPRGVPQGRRPPVAAPPPHLRRPPPRPAPQPRPATTQPPGPVVPPTKQAKGNRRWMILAALVLIALAGISWWAWSQNAGTADPSVVQRASDVDVGECVRVEGAADAAHLRTVACDFGAGLSYYVAAKVDRACPDRQYASFRLPEGSPSLMCLVPNLIQGRCYEVVPPGQTGATVRTKDLNCGTAPSQRGAQAAEVVLRRDGRRVDCPSGTTSEVVVKQPRPIQYCLRAL